MKILLCVLSLGVAVSVAAGTVHHWSFEDDALAPGGVLAVFQNGGKPAYANEVVSDQIWDGGTYSLALKGNRRSAYFGPVAVTNLAPVGGEISFSGRALDFR
ncbi:MAG: hypothetical protein HN849_21055 [Victivallales bacterium]|nr:hypothetical protein [Victivallales bacterium]MBT7302029.1 hypothetical protein [Victivallales bacterium]